MSLQPKHRIAFRGDMREWRARIEAMELAARTFCEAGGADAAQGTMELLIAAVRIAMRNSGKSAHALTDVLSDVLGNAIICADTFEK